MKAIRDEMREIEDRLNEEYEMWGRAVLRNPPEARYDPGKLAVNMVLVPFMFNPETGKIEPTWAEEKN